MSWRVATGSVTPTGAMGKEITDVLTSGWFSPGPKVAKFERLFAETHGVKHAIFVNSGTDALRIALASLKESGNWADGDEVIVPALTFVATVNTVLQLGLKPVFVDVDPQTFVMDTDRFVTAVTGRTRAVVPVHLFGLPADMPRILSAAESLNLHVVEDSCESMGVGFIEQFGPETGAKQGSIGKVGSFGSFGCFSTYACHLIVTGVGGLITTQNEDLASIARSCANHGRDPYFLGGHSGDGKDPLELIKRRFLYERIGYSSRVSEFEAAVGIPQIKTLPEAIERRNVIAKALESRLPAEEFRFQRHPCNRTHARMMFPMVLRNPAVDRDQFCLALEEKGIETRPLFPLLTQPVYWKLWGDISPDFPVAHEISERGFYVGCHPGMVDADVDYLTKTITECLPRRTYAAV